MECSPLDLIRRAMRPGLLEMLQQARANGWLLGLFSDYPATQKLQAMGLEGCFDVVACSQDPLVQRFKPDPRGITHVRERLGVAAEHTVYVGDRHDVDRIAAERAGVRSVILGPDSSLQAVAALWSDSDSSH
jgi:HAD superfamily hydrolase (TIGR01509 family)